MAKQTQGYASEPTSDEPIFDVAQLAMVEMYTPTIKETEAFFEMLGLIVVHRDVADSVYMRAYEDPYSYSIKLTERAEAGLGVASWRTHSSQALKRRVLELKKTDQGIGWVDPSFGHGAAYRFTTPAGHLFELFFEVEYYQAPEALRSKLANRPQRRPLYGIPVRRLDHLNLFVGDVNQNSDFIKNYLGFKERECLIDKNGVKGASWLSVSSLVHELAFMRDNLAERATSSRLHHIGYWYGAPQDLEHLADALTELDIPIEAGPIKHGVSQAKCMYVIEPGGNRIELFGDTGYLVFDPTFPTVKWEQEKAEKAIIWYGASLPHSYFRYGTPVLPDEEIQAFYPQ